MKHCDFSDANSIVILNSLGERQTNLTELSLRQCDLGNEGTHALTLTMQKQALKTIVIRSNNIDIACLRNLIASIRRLRSVETLDLSANAFGTAS